MTKFRIPMMVAALCLCSSATIHAQTYTLLSEPVFNPNGSLVQGTDGNFYGTWTSRRDGGIFKITPSGTLTGLATGGICNTGCSGKLVQGTDGNFYGVSGLYVFKVTPSGTLTVFASLGDDEPTGGLVLASDGNFYGTTALGGTNNDGIVFRLTPSGSLTTLYNFCSESNCTDGSGGNGPLVQGADGNLYGATAGGGTNGYGTIFKITTTGTLTTLHSFDLTDGFAPNGGLIQATDGNFYGTTYNGGLTNDDCWDDTCGTVFKMTPAGVLTTLHSFDFTDGANPSAGVVQASDGNFYGTTSRGGPCSATMCGTVFKITSTGTLTTLHDFDNADGSDPNGLIQATNGTFYGTTYLSGNANDACKGTCGTVYSLSLGLPPP